MPDDLLRASTTQAGTEPTEQGAIDEGAEQARKQSSIQRLKSQLGTAQANLQSAQAELERKDEYIRSLGSRLENLERNINPSSLEDYSIGELERHIYDPNSDMTDVARLRAYDQQINQRRLNDLKNEIGTVVERTLTEKLTQRERQNHFSQEMANLKSRYGDQLEPGGALYDAALRLYGRYVQHFGDVSKQPPVQQLLEVRAIEKAAEALGLNGSRVTRRAPEDNVEGGSNVSSGAATSEESFQKKYTELLGKGDRKGALALKLSRYVFGDT